MQARTSDPHTGDTLPNNPVYAVGLQRVHELDPVLAQELLQAKKLPSIQLVFVPSHVV
jgi:hypothetical protein